MGKQVSFDLFAKLFYKLAEDAKLNTADLKLAISLVSAFSASILACLSSQPGDMILTATYKKKAQGGFTSVVHSIYEQHGLGGFFLGLQARIMHVASIITSQLVLYDIIKVALKLPVTGSH
jgi:solute carrier family 25 phosphate transporter 3